MTDDFIVFGAPTIESDEIAEVISTLKSGWIGTGPKVRQFENDFASYKSITNNQVAAVSSCTAALHLSLITAGIGDGDEVITTAMTFCASVNAIIHSGATPVLADIDPTSWNISPDEILNKISQKTKAIVVVHFAGRCCDMAKIQEICADHNLILIEDCAHAIETELNHSKAGTFGDFGCFSFYATKNITTAEGGMVIAKDPNHISHIKKLALHGLSNDAWRRYGDSGFKHYYVEECGYKYNMTDIQASLGMHQLRRVDETHKRREEIWRRYNAELDDTKFNKPANTNSNERHGYHLYQLLLNSERPSVRDEMLDYMTLQGIGVGVHYISIAQHPYYQRKYGWEPSDYPFAHHFGKTTVSIPLMPQLPDRQVDRIIESANGYSF